MGAAAAGIVLVILLVVVLLVIAGLSLLVQGVNLLRKGDFVKGVLTLIVGLWLTLPTLLFIVRTLVQRFAGD